MKSKVKSLLAVFAVAFGLIVGVVGCSGECEHTYTDKVVDPTCSGGGYTLHTCTKCGASFSDTETEALGHDYKETVVAPQCEVKGYTLHKCSRCDEQYQDNETNVLGHDFAKTLSHNDEGHYHKCTRCDEHDTLVKHVYDEADYKFSASGHYTVCECGAKSAEQAHVYDKEVKTEDTLKSAANCFEPDTYFKSCVCGFISTVDTFTDGEKLGHDLHHHDAVAGTETTKAAIEYWECLRDDCGKLYSDAAGAEEITEADIYSEKIGRLLTVADKNAEHSNDKFVQNEDGSMSYTKAADAPANENALIWFGEQNGGDSTAWEFDLKFVSADAGTLGLVFRAWDDSNLYRLDLCNPQGHGQIQLIKRKWMVSAPQTVNRTFIDGIEIEDNADYHVEIVCLGHDKAVIINDKIVYRVQESDFCAGYFGIESKGMTSIVIKNAYLRKYVGTDIAEKRAAVEADYPDFWDDLSAGITNVCGHEYVDAVTPPTCKDDGYTTHTCKYCNNEYTDTTVPSTGAHLFDTLTNNGDKHTAKCSACGTEVEQDHSYTKEVKNEQTLKIAENHEHGATYYKSCECGAISTADDDTFTVAQVYKYLKDAVAKTDNIVQAADGTLTYTKTGDTQAERAANITFGSQDGNYRQYVEFDLQFTTNEWSSFKLQFRRWDGSSNIEISRPTEHSGDKLSAQYTKWSTEENKKVTLGAWDINGFNFSANTKYHVAILCRGWQKTVIVNDTVIFSESFEANSTGYFYFETWDVLSFTLSNIIVDESYADDNAFAEAHPEVWYKLSAGITKTEKTI